MKPDDKRPTVSPQQLLEIKKKLLEKKEKLKEELKTRHKEAYKWLVEHNIDLDNLQKYSQNIAAALALTKTLLSTHPQLITAIAPSQYVILKSRWEGVDLSTLTPQQLAQRVWELYGEIIDEIAEKYNLDPQLIFATIMTESEGNPKAYRFEAHINDASYGLGQILYTTALTLGFNGRPEDIYRPEVAIDLIGRYHKNSLDTYGKLTAEQLTIVYNSGSLWGYPHPGHLARFRDWYYNFSDTRKLANK